jgi:hypothetical protein
MLFIKRKSERISAVVMKYFIKRLYGFYLNLFAQMKEPQFREKAIKDLSKSVAILFTSDLSCLDDTRELLNFIAETIIARTPFEERVGFLVEVLQSVTQQCFRIEEEFFVSVEAGKGSVESMRSHSVLRQLLEKAQG